MSTFSTCTSLNRPSSPADGDVLFETDTKNVIVWDGSNWRGYQKDIVVPGSITNTYSLDFDGSNDYLLMGSSAINLDTDFTMSAWFKPESAALAGYDFIAGWGNAASGQSRVMQILNSKLSFEIYLSRISGATTLSAGNWYHGVITYSSNDVRVYLNGSLDGSGTLSRANMSSSNTFVGGTAAFTSAGFSPFAGLVDEFAVFDSVLSDYQISLLYNSGTPNDVGVLNPVGWWRMGDNDSGTGATVTDQGSGGNDGTLTNGPVFVSGAGNTP